MKRDPITLRTGFLLAVAGWAGATWLATGFGLGSHLPAGDRDAAAQAALPALPPMAAERMAGADSYRAIGERPLFAEDRRPRPYLLGGSEPAASAALRLTGVLLTDSFSMATFTTEQSRSLRLRLNGEAVDGWQLVALEPRQATVIGPSGSQVLELATFNGQGGEPPTVLRGANGAVPPAGVVVPPPPPPPQATQATQSSASIAQRAADAAPGAAAGPAQQPAPTNNGPSEAQMQAIRERIQARRRQLQQQQQQPSPPPGDGTNR